MPATAAPQRRAVPRAVEQPSLHGAVTDLLASQEQTFTLAQRLTVRAVERGDTQTRRELADLMQALADQYGQMSQMAEMLSEATPLAA